SPRVSAAWNLVRVCWSLVGVWTEHAYVEIVVYVRPEHVIRIRPEGVVHEIPIGEWPKQPTKPSYRYNWMAVPPPPSPIAVPPVRTIATPPVPASECTTKARARECRSAGRGSKCIITQKRSSSDAPDRSGHQIAIAIQTASETTSGRKGTRSPLPTLECTASCWPDKAPG